MPTDNAAAFLLDIRNDYMYPAIAADFMIGVRRGELLGFKWKDINFKKGTILVRRQLIRKKGGGCELVERVKTDAGYRELELPAELAELLKAHKLQQWEIRQQFLDKNDKAEGQDKNNKVVDIKKKFDPQAEDLVFCWPDGRWYTPDHFYRHLQRLLKKHKYEPLSVQGMRHTHATTSLALGTDIAVVSKNLGHTTIATTAIYLHSDRKREKAAAKKMGNAFSKKVKGTITNTITNEARKTTQKIKTSGK